MLTETKVRVGVDGARNTVFLECNGKVAMNGPREALESVARTILRKCAEAEENEKAMQIIEDGAILHKAGVSVGLSDNPQIKKEIAKEAQWGQGRKVKGVPNKEVVGTPRFISH